MSKEQKEKRQKVFDHMEALRQALIRAEEMDALDHYDQENIEGRLQAMAQACMAARHLRQAGESEGGDE